MDFLDEHTFLYCEEIILAERLMKKNYQCACCVETSVIHNHSYTVKKSLSKLKFIKSNLDSYDYYLKKYRELNLVKRILCGSFSQLLNWRCYDRCRGAIQVREQKSMKALTPMQHLMML